MNLNFNIFQYICYVIIHSYMLECQFSLQQKKMYSNKIKCMVVLAISFFSGVICNSLNLTNPCTCTKYCIKNDTENIGVSKNTPLIISFNGFEFEKI